LFDVLLLRFLSILGGSLWEAKRNLKNCYYLTEAHGSNGSSQETTARELVEEELNKIGECYEGYEQAIVVVEDGSGEGKRGEANEEEAILRSHRMQEEIANSVGVSRTLL
jgi:hypothetical protein